MDSKIVLFADATCDLNPELTKKANIHYCYYHIVMGDNDYRDGLEITPEEIFDHYRATGELPRTASISVGDYMESFRPWVEKGYEVIHVNLGNAISSSYSNCVLAAKELGNVFNVNSGNLSSATGLLVLRAAELIEEGELSAREIVAQLELLTPKIYASFVLDTLEFLKAGGRCSALMAFGATVLGIKPCIVVDNKDASMSVGKKYRGTPEKVMQNYLNDMLSKHPNIIPDKVVFTHSGLAPEMICFAKKTICTILGVNIDIPVNRASCTISSHCGPGCYGVLFMTE